ncbi:MAG: hypothetical protein ACI90V_008952, partial [Bacillariaceae sp.]
MNNVSFKLGYKFTTPDTISYVSSKSGYVPAYFRKHANNEIILVSFIITNYKRAIARKFYPPYP